MHGGGGTRAPRRQAPVRPASSRREPPHPYRRRRRRASPWSRIGTTLLTIVLLLLLYGFGALFWASSRITREPMDGLQRGDVYHVLVTGSDSRENLSADERRELTTGGDAGGERTDTIFVLSIQGSKAAMLAFPRDLFVPRCDGTEGRINAATVIGGQECLVQTVSELSGLPIRHTIQIDFLGFRDVVDAVGGVEVCLDEALPADPKAGIGDLPEGCQTLDGREALGFVRTRQVGDDFGRIQRQQQFLGALAKEVAQPATVLNPIEFYGAAGAMGSALRADDGLSSLDLLRIGLGARGVANGQVAAETVPSTPMTVGGAAVLDVTSEAEAVFDRFRTGAVFDEISGGDTVAPEDVELVVLNGSGVEGLAGRTRDALETRGFVVRDVGNAPRAQTTVVRHPEGQEAQARTLAAEAPGNVEIEQDDSVDIITLVVGADAAG
ncbi:MAG TPA: LCP family protein [Euzebyales bacterium]|nr:LCP family protein [Euzebyales bacterium]